MGITLTTKKKTKTTAPVKAKASSASKTNPIVAQAKELVDTICEQNAAILAAKEPKKVQDKARKSLLDLIEDDYSATEEITVTGEQGRVKFSAQSTKRYCTDPKAVHKMLGDEAFYAICNLGVTDLNKYLTASQMDKVVAEGYGPRTMTVLPPDKD